MNIKQAKEEIKHTVRAYLAKDAAGGYRIPAVRQRPVLLMGPPGLHCKNCSIVGAKVSDTQLISSINRIPSRCPPSRMDCP